MPIIETESLTRRYGARRGIEGVSLAVPEGSLFGFLGPNGAGKTTTIRVFLGLLRPTRGAARIFSRDCWREGPAIKAELGYLPGDLRLYSSLSGLETLAMCGRIRRRDLLPAGKELADDLELDLRVRVRQMSRGTRQKLGIVLALAHAPRLLVLDEPTSNLDPLVQARLRERLRRLAAAGYTVFFSSHSLGEVESLCDRVAIIRDGKLVAAATLDELRRDAGHEIRVRLRDGAPLPVTEPPPGLVIERRDAGGWSGRIDGPLGPVLSWLAQQPVADLAVARPDLEALFHRYYAREGGER